MKILILSLSAICYSPFSVWASFEDVGTGARAVALGGAYTAIADEVHSLYYNPAGLAQIKRQELAGSYGLLHTGLTDKSKITNTFFGYAYPAKIEMGTFGVGFQQLLLSGFYKESTLTFGYGRRFSQKWTLGMNLKYLTLSIEPPSGVVLKGGKRRLDLSDPVFNNGNSRSRMSLDLGAHYRIRKNYTLGFVFQNLNEPNMAISDRGEDKVPMTFRSGLAYKERGLTLLTEIMSKKALTTSRDYNFTLGAEKAFSFGRRQSEFAIRGAFGYGSRSYRQMNMGVGYRTDGIQFDYAFLLPLSDLSYGDAGGGHRISVALRFGKTIAEPDYEARFKEAMKSAQDAEEKLAEVQKEFDLMRDELDQLKTRKPAKRVKAVKEVREEAEAKETPAAEPTDEEKDQQKSLMASFSESIDRYWRRKLAGASTSERIKILERIKSEYQDTGVDISVINKELEIAKSDILRAESDLSSAWNYYQKIAVRGASVPDRIEMLSQIIEKFARSGVDLGYVVNEMNALKSQKR